MKKKLIGQVTVDEMKEIQSLYERKNGLTELARILTPDNQELYEKCFEQLKNRYNYYKDLKQWNMIIKVVAALIEKDGKVLIAKRATGDKSVLGKW